MKIGLISDTHIPEKAKTLPKAIYKCFDGASLILHAGDLTNLSVLDELRTITPNVEAVSGNMDQGEDSCSLPRKKIIPVGGVRIALIHGWGPRLGLKDRIFEDLKNENPQVIVFGHSHSPEKTYKDGVLFVNPGTPTNKTYADVNSVAVMNIEKEQPLIDIIRF